MFGIGIDVSAGYLDATVHGQAFKRFENNKRGYASLNRWLQKWPAKQVVLEASGGYEQKALDALHEAGLQMHLHRRPTAGSLRSVQQAAFGQP